MNINEILKKSFTDEIKIIEKIQSGLRCETYLIEENNKKYIFQIYTENTKYQAKKKYDILNLFDIEIIPKAYKYEEFNDYSYLITKYIEANTLTDNLKNEKFNFKDIVDELTKTLVKIHSIQKEKVFGWITDNKIIKNEKLIDYINSEYKRLIPDLENLDKQTLEKIKNKIEKVLKIIEEKTKDVLKSSLCWYDINPDNILIEKKEDKFKIKGLLDPGGARYGIKEWDLAFIKMEMLKSEEEFKLLIDYYEKNSKEKVDIELLNALSVMVELNDISFMIVDKVKLPMPYDSNFKEERN